MAVELTMFEEGQEIAIGLHYKGEYTERRLRVLGVDDDPAQEGRLHRAVLVLRCESVPRGTPCLVEKLKDGRARFRYESSWDSPQRVHYAGYTPASFDHRTERGDA